MRGLWDDFRRPFSECYQEPRRLAYRRGGNPDCTLCFSAPKAPETGFTTVAFLHGGGLTGGQREIPDELYDGRRAVVEIRYRLSPAVSPVDCLADAAAAAAFLFRHLAGWGGDLDRLFWGGMSAGAYLAAMVGMNPALLKKHRLAPRFAGLLLASGQMTTHFHLKDALGYDRLGARPVIDRFAPFRYASAALPPILLVTGEPGLDIAARPEENEFFAATLRTLGHPFVEYHRLAGTDHRSVLDRCGPLFTDFIDRVEAKKR